MNVTKITKNNRENIGFQRRLDDKNIYKNAKTKQFIAYVIKATPVRKLA